MRIFAKLLLALTMLMPSLGMAQNGYFTDRAVGVSQFNGFTGLVPIGYGQVRVCTNVDINTFTSPCPDVATVFNLAGSQLAVQGGNFGQVTTDVVGRFNFQAAPGSYWIQVAGSSSNTPQLQYAVTVPPIQISNGAFILSGSNIWTGTNIFNGSVIFANINGMVNPQFYGAKADVVTLNDGGITTSTTTFTSASGAFVVTDAINHKAIVIHGAGVAGVDLVTTISTFVSSTSVTLSSSASTTVSGALTYYGTDDTAAIRSCINNGTNTGKRCNFTNGATYMVSNTASTILITGTGGVLDGNGTVIFAPIAPFNGGTNDRFLYAVSTVSPPFTLATPIQIAAGAIAKGATSFPAQNAGDVSSWVKGDWIVVTEKDAAFGDMVYADWMQVSSVAGTTVNVMGAFRMAFPNARTWNVSGTPAGCAPASPCGLSARHLGPNIVSDITYRDFSIIIPKMGANITGIATFQTLGTVIDNVKCNNASMNCFFHYQDKRIIWRHPHINNVVASEISASVDWDITLDASMVGTPVNGFVPPVNGPLTIDIGSGFGSMGVSNLGNATNSNLFLNGGIHDSTFNGVTFGWLTGTTSGGDVFCLGCYNNIFNGMVMPGGDGLSHGFLFGDTSGYTVNINSDNNKMWGLSNTVLNFPSTNANAFSCAGSLNTDVCGDLVLSATQPIVQGLTTATFLSIVSLPLTPGEWDIQGTLAFSGTATSPSGQFAAISTSSSTFVPNDNTYKNIAEIVQSPVAAVSATTPLYHVTVNSNTTYFLVAFSTFTGGTSGAQGSMTARRVR